MLCEEILGTLSDEKFLGLRVDYVDIEWYEAFSRLHRKTSAEGSDIGIRMKDGILSRGLHQDDVIYADSQKVIVVNILPCEAIQMTVQKDCPQQIAKLCYEVGNTHTTMFRGADDFTFYTPYHEPLMDKINHIHGVTAKKLNIKFDFSKTLSSSINNHHH